MVVTFMTVGRTPGDNPCRTQGQSQQTRFDICFHNDLGFCLLFCRSVVLFCSSFEFFVASVSIRFLTHHKPVQVDNGQTQRTLSQLGYLMAYSEPRPMTMGRIEGGSFRCERVRLNSGRRFTIEKTEEIRRTDKRE